MKLTLTKEEIRKLVISKFYLKQDEQLAIEIADNPPVVHNYSSAQTVAQLVEVINCLNLVENKILAIKILRVLTGYDLCHAKWAVENWDKWKTHALCTSKIPEIRGQYNNFYL